MFVGCMFAFCFNGGLLHFIQVLVHPCPFYIPSSSKLHLCKVDCTDQWVFRILDENQITELCIPRSIKYLFKHILPHLRHQSLLVIPNPMIFGQSDPFTVIGTIIDAVLIKYGPTQAKPATCRECNSAALSLICLQLASVNLHALKVMGQSGSLVISNPMIIGQSNQITVIGSSNSSAFPLICLKVCKTTPVVLQQQEHQQQVLVQHQVVVGAMPNKHPCFATVWVLFCQRHDVLILMMVNDKHFSIDAMFHYINSCNSNNY